MPFVLPKRVFRTVGFRIAFWHSATFVTGAILLFTAAYFLLRRSVDEQAREAIEFRLNQFVWEYERGGKQAVIDLCNLRRGRAQRAFFVRLADADNVTAFLRDRDDWLEFKPETLAGQPVPAGMSWKDLEGLEDSILRMAAIRLPDGNVLQVGKSLDERKLLLSRFRSALIGIGTIVIVAVRLSIRMNLRRVFRRAGPGTKSMNSCAASTKCLGRSSC